MDKKHVQEIKQNLGKITAHLSKRNKEKLEYDIDRSYRSIEWLEETKDRRKEVLKITKREALTKERQIKQQKRVENKAEIIKEHEKQKNFKNPMTVFAKPKRTRKVAGVEAHQERQNQLKQAIAEEKRDKKEHLKIDKALFNSEREEYKDNVKQTKARARTNIKDIKKENMLGRKKPVLSKVKETFSLAKKPKRSKELSR